LTKTKKSPEKRADSFFFYQQRWSIYILNADDTKKILQHAEMSLKYAQDADDEAIENINTQGAEHITASIAHLEEAIKHAKMGHADVASKHIDEALNEMHQYTAKLVDYLAE